MFPICSIYKRMTWNSTKNPDLAIRGRGANSNAAGRYERLDIAYEDDGWDRPLDAMVLRTTVQEELPRSVITYNRSPDLPFDRSLNPYRGCEHGCIYCFARPSHAWLGMSPGLDFETRLIARPKAAEVLEDELRKPGYRCKTLAMGTNTDPYQPIEKTYEITRSCLKVLDQANHPIAIVTKGSLIERDVDILSDMAARGLVRVGVSVTTLDPKLARKMEPRVPHPARRLQIISRLSEAGIPVRVMASPIVPGLNDHEIEAILQAGKEAGARAASWIMLRLPREVSPLFQEWLQAHYPNRADKIMGLLRGMHRGQDYLPDWSHRMRGEGRYAEMIAARFDLTVRRLGLDAHLAPMRTDLFCRPEQVGDQLRLF